MSQQSSALRRLAGKVLYHRMSALADKRRSCPGKQSQTGQYSPKDRNCTSACSSCEPESKCFNVRT